MSNLEPLARYVASLLDSVASGDPIPEHYEEIDLLDGLDETGITTAQKADRDRRRHDAYTTATDELAKVLGYTRCDDCRKWLADGWPRCVACDRRVHRPRCTACDMSIDRYDAVYDDYDRPYHDDCFDRAGEAQDQARVS